MCPAVTVAVRDNKPFMRLFRSPFRSAPFERYIKALRSGLGEKGVKTSIFRSSLYHQWFMCMWTAGQRNKLREQARRYDAVVVLGCESATETVRDAIESTDCRVIEGMEVAGIMNGRLRFRLPCDVSFDDCKVAPISRESMDHRGPQRQIDE
jgi:hypothetical protein